MVLGAAGRGRTAGGASHSCLHGQTMRAECVILGGALPKAERVADEAQAARGEERIHRADKVDAPGVGLGPHAAESAQGKLCVHIAMVSTSRAKLFASAVLYLHCSAVHA